MPYVPYVPPGTKPPTTPRGIAVTVAMLTALLALLFGAFTWEVYAPSFIQGFVNGLTEDAGLPPEYR
ncbi:MAG TPA: hypothetical protein VNQ77_04580 [Frankiaceae bacterium]|nr:hypothetical protein [Frankiaceae bacterium]